MQFSKSPPKMVTDIKKSEHEKRQQKGFQRLDGLPKDSSKKAAGKPKKTVGKSQAVKPQVCEISEPSSSLLFEQFWFKEMNLRNLIFFLLPNCITKLSISKSFLDKNQETSSIMNHFSEKTQRTFVKLLITFKHQNSAPIIFNFIIRKKWETLVPYWGNCFCKLF